MLNLQSKNFNIKTIALIQPAIEEYYLTRQRTQPTGLIYLASALEKNGYYPSILDCLTVNKKKIIATPEKLKYLEDYYTADISPIAIFSKFQRFGLNAEEFADLISQQNFDIFGISSNFTAYYKTVEDYCRVIRKIFPNKIIILGGHNTAIMDRYFLINNLVDFVIYYQSTIPLMKLLNLLNQNSNDSKIFIDKLQEIENLAFFDYKKNQVIQTTKNIEFKDINQTFFKLDYVNNENYRIGRNKLMTIITSCGCPYNCDFCSTRFHLPKFIKKDIGLVKEELRYNIDKFKITALNIEDENFTFDKARALELLNFISVEFPELRLYFMNGLHYLHLDDDLLQSLKKAGLYNLNLSIGNLNINQNDKLSTSRFCNLEKLENIVNLSKKMNLYTTIYFIIGHPDDTINSIFEMLKFLCSLKVNICPSIYYYLPGLNTNNLDKFINKNINFEQMRMTAAAIETPNFKRLDLITFFRLIRIKNILQEQDFFLNEYYHNNDAEIKEIIKKIKANDFLLFTDKKLDTAMLLAICIKYLIENKRLISVTYNKTKNNQFIYKFYECKQNFEIVNWFIENILFTSLEI